MNYVECIWCKGVSHSAATIHFENDEHLCKRDAGLVPNATTAQEALSGLKALLKALPYPSKRGYTYQPQRFTGDGPVKGVTGFKEHPERGHLPFFATAAEAVAYLVKHGLVGQVQKFKITPDLIHRTYRLHGFDTDMERIPWLTAGVTDVVSESVESAPIQPMNLFKDKPVQIHIQVGVKSVGGFGELTEEDWNRLEGEDGV